MPMRRMPVLEIDGKKIFESLAICRYLARLYGLAGDDEWESLQIDMIADMFNDLRVSKYRKKLLIIYKFDMEIIIFFPIELTAIRFEPDEKIKEEKLEKLSADELPFTLNKLDEIAGENGGFLANGKVIDYQ